MSLSVGLRASRVRSWLPGHGFSAPTYRTIRPTRAAAPRRLISSTLSAQASVFARAASSSAAAAATTATANAPTTTTTTTTTLPRTPRQTMVPTQRPSPSTLQPSHPKPNPPAPVPTTTTTTTLFSPLLNPPSTTRPPPLDVPTRDPSTSYVRYLYHLGKAYTTFYKAGLKAIFTNRRLLSSSPPSSPPPRSHLLLRARVRHDLARLPVFALVVLACSELTPFVVLLFPRLTPYTCRIPRQAAKIRRAARARREASSRALRTVRDNQGPAAALARADGHVCRALGLTGRLWDRVGLDGPRAAPRAAAAVRALALDDALLREGGGAAALEDPEVVIACEDRAIDVPETQEQGQDGAGVGELRAKLDRWLARTAPGGKEGEAAEDKIRRALLGLDGRI